MKDKEKFFNDWYKKHSIVQGPQEIDYRNWKTQKRILKGYERRD